jgi:hypothetical protein
LEAGSPGSWKSWKLEVLEVLEAGSRKSWKLEVLEAGSWKLEAEIEKYFIYNTKKTFNVIYKIFYNAILFYEHYTTLQDILIL